MIYHEFADQLITLRNVDLAFREKLVKSGQLGEGYHAEMAKIHKHNAEALDEIMETIGYPSIDKVGQEASAAAWLIIQHAISHPQFMKKCAVLLKAAVTEHQADPKNLAYLKDRIAVFEGKPQLFGTQFDWDANGELSPNVYDDLSKVNERRKILGLNTLEEQTKVIRQQAKDENQAPPPDYLKRKAEIEKWKKSVGWI